MKFDSDIGKLQRLMAESIAGTSRRNAVLSEMRIQSGDTIIDVGCGAGHLLPHLAKAVGGSGTIYGLDPNTDQMEQAKKRCEDFQNISLVLENVDSFGPSSPIWSTIIESCVSIIYIYIYPTAQIERDNQIVLANFKNT